MEITMKKTVLMFTALLLLPFLAERTFACSCASGGTVCDAYQKSAAIFVGTVLSDTTVTVQMEVTTLGKGKQIETYSEKLYVFAVEQSFKGVEGTVLEVQTGIDDGDCGIEFRKGERYLVYAYLNTKTKKLHTGICTRTNSVSNASEDLNFLRGLPDSALKSRISGKITQIRYESDALYEYKYQKMSGVKVTLKGEKSFESVTNDQGIYLFVNIPPGTYQLKADLPATLSNKEYEIELPVAGCARRDISTQIDGRIAGKVLDNQGQVVEGAKIKLIPADIAQNETSMSISSRSHSEKTDKEGRYEFKELTPGKYYLGIYLNEEPRGEFPYPKTYYPGTTDQEKATVIVLGEGEKLAGYDLTLPSALSVKTVEGIFVWSAGRPVRPGNVHLTDSPDPEKKGRIYASSEVDKQGHFSLQGFDNLEGWLHGSTYTTVGGRMEFVDIKPVKIKVAEAMKPTKLIAPVPSGKQK
jgi:hypothetical protein